MFPTMWSSLDKNKNASAEDLKKVSAFMFCRWLAGNPSTIRKAAEYNIYPDIPVENMYYSTKYEFAGKIRNIKWVKSETEDIDQNTIDMLCAHFKISVEKAKEYLSIISTEELEYLKELYRPRK